MKKLSKLKLNQLSDANLRDREMNGLRGGNTCTCSCLYAYPGGSGSSSSSNMDANYNIGSGGYSTSGCNQYMETGNGSVYTLYCPNCTE